VEPFAFEGCHSERSEESGEPHSQSASAAEIMRKQAESERKATSVSRSSNKINELEKS
jgi:hypothetical protein